MKSPTYSGRIVDGPWAGKSETRPYKSFTVAFCPPPRAGDDADSATGAVEEILHGTYEWHPHLCAWVWRGVLR